jgi:ferritin-like metal-binding protein YciE
MADPTARELKLIQYLNEAYGKERQLETDLKQKITVALKPALKKRLQEHHRETKAQIKGLERRIKALGGKADASSIPGPEAITSVANKALAAAKGPIETLRGTSPADLQLRNVRDGFWNEAEEIAHYDIIESLAKELADTETAKLASEFRRQEERMQKFLERQIASLVKDVVRAEVPARERKPGGTTTRRKRSSSSSSRSTSRSTSRSSSSRSSSSGSSGTKSTARAKAGAKGGRKTAAKRSTSGTSRSSGSRTTSRSTNGASASSRSRSGSGSGRRSSGSRSGGSSS